MLNFVATPKKIPATITDVNGDVVNIEFRQFTISDLAFQKPLLEENAKETDNTTSFINFMRIRLISCVHNVDTGSRMWQNLAEFEACDYPAEMVAGLSEAVEKVNPLPPLTGKTTDDKKK